MSFGTTPSTTSTTSTFTYDVHMQAELGNEIFYQALADFVQGISHGDSGSIQLPDGTYIENINTPTGITQFTTWIQMYSATHELVNKTLQLTVTFEKQIGNLTSSG